MIEEDDRYLMNGENLNVRIEGIEEIMERAEIGTKDIKGHMMIIRTVEMMKENMEDKYIRGEEKENLQEELESLLQNQIEMRLCLMLSDKNIDLYVFFE